MWHLRGRCSSWLKPATTVTTVCLKPRSLRVLVLPRVINGFARMKFFLFNFNSWNMMSVARPSFVLMVTKSKICCPIYMICDPFIKGWPKNPSPPKIWPNSGGRMVCPRRLSFSPFVVLMSMTNCEKDSLLGQTVLPPELGQFFGHALFPCWEAL